MRLPALLLPTGAKPPTEPLGLGGQIRTEGDGSDGMLPSHVSTHSSGAGLAAPVRCGCKREAAALMFVPTRGDRFGKADSDVGVPLPDTLERREIVSWAPLSLAVSKAFVRSRDEVVVRWAVGDA